VRQEAFGLNPGLPFRASDKKEALVADDIFHCSSEVESQLRSIRDLLYRGVQNDIADELDISNRATKEAYERLSALFDRLQSNLVRPADVT
jgi:hypothetical protein